MTPERWTRVQKVFEAALERPADARSSFLRTACGDDEELRREVESLLASHEEVSSEFLKHQSVARRLDTGARLGAYEIVDRIGSGGMGEVYRARDQRLERDVAIKVLPAHLSANPEALARFEREAKAVAALSHPNILSIFDVGSQDGTSYAVMELLEGETLRSKLSGGGLPQRQAVDYAGQMAKGLAAAHERGVVHRDLKPENLFISKDGHLKILDFGLAKREEPVPAGKETSAPTASGHTEPGTVMGTVGYMSPEQVRGQAVDHRSDIFSFGAILYEMLSGKRAFQRHTAADTMSAILKEEPPELTTSGHAIPPLLDHTIKHCLEKDRDHRFQSARDIQFALSESSGPTTFVAKPVRRQKRGWIAGGVLVAVATAVGLLLAGRPETPTSRGVKRIAVLPFENLGAPEDDYFADGIADAVRGKLTMLPGVEVIARASSTSYKKSSKTPQQIAAELDAPFLLTATVRWDKGGGGSRVQVSPELVEVSGRAAPASRWQQPFDASLTDVFQVQSDIATKVAQSLGVVIGASDARQLRETPTASLAAYDAFLKGEEVWRRSLGWNVGFEEMIQSYEQAVALDPGFAEAWARLSRARTHRYETVPSPELADQARSAAERAAALAPDSPEAHLAMGEFLFWVRHDAERALAEFDKAQRLAPGNVDLLISRSYVESTLGRTQEAEEHARQANRLDPRSVQAKQLVAGDLANRGKYREARELLDQALALDPKNPGLVLDKAMSYLNQGDLAGARLAVGEAAKGIPPTTLVAYLANVNDLVWVLEAEQRDLLLRLTPNEFESEEVWAICLAQASWLNRDEAGRRKYAEIAARGFRRRLEVEPQDAESLAFLGLSLAYLGRKEEAVRNGERAVSLRPLEKGFSDAPYCQHQLVRIYTLVGEPDKAIDALEPLLKLPYSLTPAWLRIDPNFDPLRSNPRFQKLAGGA